MLGHKSLQSILTNLIIGYTARWWFVSHEKVIPGDMEGIHLHHAGSLHVFHMAQCLSPSTLAQYLLSANILTYFPFDCYTNRMLLHGSQHVHDILLLIQFNSSKTELLCIPEDASSCQDISISLEIFRSHHLRVYVTLGLFLTANYPSYSGPSIPRHFKFELLQFASGRCFSLHDVPIATDPVCSSTVVFNSSSFPTPSHWHISCVRFL